MFIKTVVELKLHNSTTAHVFFNRKYKELPSPRVEIVNIV